MPGVEFNIAVHATDLGSQMTYHGNAKLGIISDRLEIAKKRLDTIKHSNWALPVKSHVVSASVYPLATYGTELLPVGQKQLNQLRTAAAEALVGEHVPSMSSVIFLHCVDLKDMDPNLIVIVNAVKAARRFLRSSPEAMKQAFLTIVSRPGKHVGLSQGPASALREYLQRIGLTCSCTGNIQVTAMRTCNLLLTPMKDLHRYLRWAWQENLLLMHTQRTKLFNLPPIIKDETVRCLKKFAPSQQLLLLREIAGAFQSKHQQSSWNNQVPDTCDYCGQDSDTRAHRAFECSAVDHIRHEYRDFVDDMKEHHADFAELPVVHLHPHYEFHDALLHSFRSST